MKYDLSFSDMELVYKSKRVTLEFIGEGLEGDYDEKDKNDIPLLRFSCDKRDESGNWEGMEDASYCTRLPINTPMINLVTVLGVIMEAIQDVNYKRELERLSWLCPDDLKLS